MAHDSLCVRPAFISSKEKLPDRLLFSGKIERPEISGFVFYIFEILSPWFPANKIKKLILQTLEKTRPNSEPADPESYFESLIIELNNGLEALSEGGEREWVGNLNAIVGAQYGDDLIITQTGNISGYIFRKGKISAITEKTPITSPPLPANTFTDITGGKIANGDRIIFGNPELYNHLSLDKIRRFAEEKRSEETIAEMFRFFRRQKIFEVNVAAIEVSDMATIESRTLEALPTVLFLDEPIEGVVSYAKKKCLPVVQRMSARSKVVSNTATKQGIELLKKSKQTWDQSLGPKTKELIKVGQQQSVVLAQTTKSKLGPTVQKSFAQLKENEQLKKIKVKASPYIPKAKKLAPISGKLPSKAQSFFDALLLPKNRIYLYGSLIVIFLIIGYYKISANSKVHEQQKNEQIIISSYDEAATLYSKAKDDLTLGKNDGLTELNNALALAIKAEEHESTQEKAKALAAEIQQSIDRTAQITRTQNPTPLFTLGENIVNLTASGTEVYGINQDGKIYYSDLRDKESSLVASIGKENGNITDISFSESLKQVYVLTDTDKVLLFDPVSKTYSPITITKDGTPWEKATAITNFATNLYLLASDGTGIWKHVKTDGGYAEGTKYVNTSKVSITDGVDFAVDGDIYILRKNGSIAKFTRGVYDTSFSIKGIPSPNNQILNPTQIYTDTDSTNIFVLDKQLNRIIKFTKSGDFVSQYILDNVPIEQFTVNTKLQKIWVLSKDKIYEISM